jgi:hypothetical protein
MKTMITNKITKERKKEIGCIISELIGSTYDSGVYWQDVYDYVQSHAIYGISKDRVDDYKNKLKKLGATKFRVVKNSGNPILCFNAEKIKYNDTNNS